jgi:hypothetical protein
LDLVDDAAQPVASSLSTLQAGQAGCALVVEANFYIYLHYPSKDQDRIRASKEKRSRKVLEGMKANNLLVPVLEDLLH